MAAPLNTCTAIEQRGVVRFLCAKDMAAKDIHKEMLPCTVNIACHAKQSIIGCRSSRKVLPDDDAVERAVCAWLRQQPQEFYAAGFQGPVKRWDKCLNLYGDYVEK